MRTPGGRFVLFQFRGEHKGLVQLQPGPTKEAHAHFAKLILWLDTKLTGTGYQRTRWEHPGGRYKAPPRMTVSFVRYRVAPGVTETWFGIPEEALSELCAEFSDKVAHAGQLSSDPC